MSMQEPNRPPRQRPAGAGAPARPATPIVAVIVAAVAGLLGLLILRNVQNDPGDSGFTDNTEEITDSTDVTDDSFVDSVPDSTVTPVLVRTGAAVVVSNASGKKGAAGALTEELKARGYETGKAFTANSGTLYDTTQVLAAPGDATALAVAKTVLLEMGLTGEPGILDESAPVKQSDVGTATVLVLLGLDRAGQSLLPLGGDSATATTEVAIEASLTTPGS
jgi:hypothetical protein